ncbi:unnamed protein product, partial [marine sediment metagenome]
VITNVAAGLSEGAATETSHDHVLQVSRKVAPTLASLLEGVLRRIP